MSVRSLLSTRPREAVLDLYNIVLAAFLFIAPWVFAYSNKINLDMWMTSAAIAVLAIVAYANWQEWANILLSAWLIASPWLLHFTRTQAMHVSVSIGWAIALMAGIELVLRYDPPEEGAPPKLTK
jgi:Na+-translocating ferredoxin:NAD+ oxidoreductase RnfA subunit